jgi:hypothetical protein
MAFKNGTRLPVTMAQVFPQGCHLMPDSITEAIDYDEQTRTRTPAIDKLTGKRVFQCRVADIDPELEGRSRETVVKITGRPAAGPAHRAAVRAGRVRRAASHALRGLRAVPGQGQVRGADGVLAARHRDQSGPPGGEGCGLMPARRVTTVTLPVDGRSGVAFETYRERTPLLTIWAARPGLLVTLTLPGHLNAGHVRFARDLATMTARYAAEVERRWRGLPQRVASA